MMMNDCNIATSFGGLYMRGLDVGGIAPGGSGEAPFPAQILWAGGDFNSGARH